MRYYVPSALYPIRCNESYISSHLSYVDRGKNLRQFLLFALLALLLVNMASASGISEVAMRQPGIDLAESHIDNNSYMVALQPATTATTEDIQKAIGVLIDSYGRAANETGYSGKLQIGVTTRAGRVIYMLDVGSSEAISHINDAKWLEKIYERGQTFVDDPRNYDPYDHRYTPFPSGKGVLGSMVYPWLGYKFAYNANGKDVWV